MPMDAVERSRQRARLDSTVVTSERAGRGERVRAAALPEAVLWDMDGTLIDSEPYWFAEEHALVESFGGTWTDAHARALVGNPLEVSAQYILDHSPVQASVEEIVDRLMRGVMKRIQGRVPWRAGALELLVGLHEAGVPNALVTMSWRPLTDLVVSLVPAGAFDAVVTGDAVGHGKPHPEPYLKAAVLLGVDARYCVAIEDSPAGVASAVAAGVPTIAVPHVVPVPRMAGAVQLPSLRGLQPEDLLVAVAAATAATR
jgi:HAD superfamily hydrolase (TIGR01509 family)